MSASLNNPPKKNKKLTRKRWWRKIHRLVGIFSVSFLLVLAATGIMLNHLEDWFDGDQYVKSKVLLDWYAIKEAQDVFTFTEVSGAPTSSFWADGQLFISAQPRAANLNKPLGMISYSGLLYLVTESKLHLFSPEGDFVEHIAFPEKINAAALVDSELLIKGRHRYRVSMDELTLEPMTEAIDISDTQNLSNSIVAQAAGSSAANIARQNRLLQSKVVQDIHSGRIFGYWGVLFFDLLGVCFIALAVSGIFLWSRGLSKPRRA
jgi:hypothetical protein